MTRMIQIKADLIFQICSGPSHVELRRSDMMVGPMDAFVGSFNGDMFLTYVSLLPEL